jgi:hypothetical protein
MGLEEKVLQIAKADVTGGIEDRDCRTGNDCVSVGSDRAGFAGVSPFMIETKRRASCYWRRLLPATSTSSRISPT